VDSQDEDECKRRLRWTRAEAVAVVVPAAVMLALGLWGLDRGGMWGDEGVTFLVGRRTVPQIWRLLHGVDAVHGLYYLFMHVVLAVRPDEVALRLPSVCGATATAGLVAALGVRLARPRVGLWAGLLYAVTPLTGHYAQEGRSYALVAAGVAGATLLLVRALDERPGRGRSWWPYGAVLAVTFVLHEFAVLVLCAHALTLAAARVPRAVWAGWGRAVGVAGGVLLPLAWVSQRQSGQVAWLRTPDWDTTERLAREFLAVAPTGVVFWTSALLILVGLGAGRLAAVALPLLVVPPVLLLTVSQFRPLFHERYVLYALAGAPLLAAAGADRLVGVMGGLRLRSPAPPVALAGVLAVAVAFLHGLPTYRNDRSPAHRPENLAAVSALAGREMRPGDPVLFLPSFWRVTALAYPGPFVGARDMALGESGSGSGTLSGREVAPGELRQRLAAVDRVWIVAQSNLLPSRWVPGDPTDQVKLDVVDEEFARRQEYVRGRVKLGLYVRRMPPPVLTGAPASPPPTVPPRPARR
jgi:mannosyltransferase